MSHTFSITEAISFGWEKVKSNSGIVFQVVLTLLGIQVVNAIVQKVLEGSALGFIAGIVLFVVQVFVGAGIVVISLKLVRGHHAHYADIWPEWMLVVRFFFSGILAGLAAFAPIAVAGLIALLTGFATVGNLITWSNGQPSFDSSMINWASVGSGIAVVAIVGVVALCIAIYIGLRFAFARFAVIDGARIVESLHKSAVLTRGVKWKLLGFIIVLALLNILGAILLLVGLLVTIPITMLATAHVYNKLKSHHG